mmetsp:Transcript_14415/g.34131  ORF Transcript_14415/g.34131 Transcript_14415/m.34131 type:complete len:389 (+) Transcript_14415:577-1743(+)
MACASALHQGALEAARDAAPPQGFLQVLALRHWAAKHTRHELCLLLQLPLLLLRSCPEGLLLPPPSLLGLSPLPLLSQLSREPAALFPQRRGVVCGRSPGSFCPQPLPLLGELFLEAPVSFMQLLDADLQRRCDLAGIVGRPAMAALHFIRELLPQLCDFLPESKHLAVPGDLALEEIAGVPLQGVEVRADALADALAALQRKLGLPPCLSLALDCVPRGPLDLPHCLLVQPRDLRLAVQPPVLLRQLLHPVLELRRLLPRCPQHRLERPGSAPPFAVGDAAPATAAVHFLLQRLSAGPSLPSLRLPRVAALSGRRVGLQMSDSSGTANTGAANCALAHNPPPVKAGVTTRRLSFVFRERRHWLRSHCVRYFRSARSRWPLLETPISE